MAARRLLHFSPSVARKRSSLRSSRAASCAGEKRLTRLAASSMARGSRSNRSTNSRTGLRASSDWRSRFGRTLLARSAKSSTASSIGRPPRGHSTSRSRPSETREVTSQTSFGASVAQTSRSSARRLATCSALSRMSSASPREASARAIAVRAAPASAARSSGRPRTLATA